MKNWIVLASLSALIAAASPAPIRGGDLSRMPVKEVTVFKDGHAFVLQEGSLAVGSGGDVTLDHLAAPVLGTFWPYSAEKGVPLKAVVAGEKRVRTQRTPLGLLEFIEANPGADVMVAEKAVASTKEGPRYEATLLGIPQRSATEVEASLPPGSGLRLPEKGSVVLLKTAEGTKVLPLDRIQDLTLRGQPQKTLATDELRTSLTLTLDWSGRTPAPEARVGLAYLQKGLRWIPSYRVELDGKGTASVRLQATLVNNLTDLEDVTAHLVIGVPSFAFAGEVDPMALQKETAQLGGRLGAGYATANAFSNAIMTQTANVGMLGGDNEQATRGPEIAGGERAEDLYVFTVRGVTLRKGERMVLPVGEASFRYKDVYTLEIPALPPPEVSGQRTLSGRDAEVARMLATPKVIHKVRWTNTGKEPLTTAPALVLSGGRPLAQGLMTYAAPGAWEELEITAAVDVPVMKSEAEVRRVPDAVVWNNDAYTQVFLKGTVTLTNRRGEPVEIEVTRRVLGVPDTASQDGTVKKLNPLEEPEAAFPGWWSWYSWPYWWSHFNGLGKISWTFKLEPGKSVELEYSWHYFWR
jgi:hypothetical protein